MRWCYSEYEKVFIQSVYNFSRPTQLQEEKKTF